MTIQTYAKTTAVPVCSLLLLCVPVTADDTDDAPGWRGGWGMGGGMMSN